MHDATVIGAGPNGLSAAAVLLRAGRSVVIYEGSRAIGGASATGEVTVPGFRHDLGAAVHPLGASSPLFRSLSLDRYGLEWLRPEIPLAHPLDGGRAVTLHHSITGTADLLAEDGPLYRQVVGGLARRWDVIANAVFGPVLRIPDHPLALAGLGLRGLLPAATAAKRLHTEEGRALVAGPTEHQASRGQQPSLSYSQTKATPRACSVAGACRSPICAMSWVSSKTDDRFTRHGTVYRGIFLARQCVCDRSCIFGRAIRPWCLASH